MERAHLVVIISVLSGGMFLANMQNIDMTTSWGELGWSFTSTTCSQLCLGRPLCVAWKKASTSGCATTLKNNMTSWKTNHEWRCISYKERWFSSQLC